MQWVCLSRAGISRRSRKGFAKTMFIKPYVYLYIIFLCCSCSIIEYGADDYKVDHSGRALPASLTTEDYDRATQFIGLRTNKRLIQNDRIVPNWIPGGDDFWYRQLSSTGDHKFVRVASALGKTNPAFDHQAIASEIERLTTMKTSPDKLPFEQFVYNEKGGIDFEIDGKHFSCADMCVARSLKATKARDTEVISPDGRWVIYAQNHNIWVRSRDGGDSFPLTSDGAPNNAYGGSIGGDLGSVSRKRFGKAIKPFVIFSPSGDKIVFQQIDERKVGLAHLLEHVPENGQFRSQLHSYRYALALDENKPLARFVVFDMETWSRTDIQYPALPIIYGPHAAPDYPQLKWRDGEGFYFFHRRQFGKGFVINYADAQTGVVRRVVERIAGAHAFPAYTSDEPGILYPVGQDKIIWWSDETGWGHLYLTSTNGQSTQLTDGNWVAIDVLRVDEDTETIFFTRQLSEAEGNPYHVAVSSVSFNGDNFRTLTKIPGYRAVTRDDFSPTGKFFVDNVSNGNNPGISSLITSDGEMVSSFEKANITKLKALGFIPPETFTVTAADGKTKLWGRLMKPTHFDPSKLYPVVDAIYPGPQVIRTYHGFADDWSTAQSLAELGFIVITLDGRGTPKRSRSFYYGKGAHLLAHAGSLADHVAAIKELSKQRPYMDLSRVGIYGNSGGGYASTRALLTYPEFFKVAVSSNGNHDQRTYIPFWGESYIGAGDTDCSASDVFSDADRYFGSRKVGQKKKTDSDDTGVYPISAQDHRLTPASLTDAHDGKKNRSSSSSDASAYGEMVNCYALSANSELASRLKGKLLLVVGEMDDNVHPTATYRLIDALVRAGKDFDFLALPSSNHVFRSPSGMDRPYYQRRLWDYFVKNLLGAEPPSQYQIVPPYQ